MTMSHLTSMCAVLGNHIWQSTAFALLVWLLTLAFRRNSAGVRYSLWVAASLKFLVPFSLLVGIGSVLPRGRQVVVSPHHNVYSVASAFANPLPSSEDPPTDVTSKESGPIVRRVPFVLTAAAAIWTCGIASLTLVWFLRWRRLVKRLRHALPVHQGREFNALRQIGDRLPILKSRDLMEPSIFGIIRPVLIWPEGLSECLDDEHLSAIVMHEVMHARRRDNLIAAGHMIVEIAFWFHPLVWWMERRMIAERESACDESVVQLLGRAETYAESLVKACRFCVESPLPCVSGITGSDLNHRIVSIMTNRLETLGVTRKMMLMLFGMGTFLCPVVFGMVHTLPLYGQVLYTNGPLPSFEVATIKPMPSGPPPTPAPPGGSTVHLFFTPKMLVMYAYNLPDFSEEKILKGAAWMDDIYEVQGKISDSDYAAMQKMPSAERQEQIQLMLQSFLKDRMKLKVHMEKRQEAVYALEVAKTGAKLSPAQEGMPKRFGVTDRGQTYELKANGVDLDLLAQLLGRQPEIGGRSVVNKTGLTGSYYVALRWTRTTSETAVTDGAPTPGEIAPSYFTAIQEQLGLRLVATKGQVDYVIVDQIEKPSPN